MATGPIVSAIWTDADHDSAVARLARLIIADRAEDTELMESLAMIIEEYEKRDSMRLPYPHISLRLPCDLPESSPTVGSV
jgi:hypothetical protein